MKKSQIYSLLLITAVTIIVWLFISWPLPKNFSSGIPAIGNTTKEENVGYMIPGDHLQLLYHFHLADNMLTGKTPLFYNMYEFNTGDDSERYEKGSYYIPFSLIYAVFTKFGDTAFGWNMTGLISLLLTFFFTWNLTKRYVPEKSWASAVAIISILLPYRWITLLGGSPTGFAMTLIPMLLQGLDIAVRDKKWQGGLLAGIAVIFSYCSDLHVFFFAILIIPVWCIIAFTIDNKNNYDSNLVYYRKIITALTPVIILVFFSYLLSRNTASELANASMANGWSLNEVAGYSPAISCLFNIGGSGLIFIGYTISIIIVTGYLILTLRMIRKTASFKNWAVLSLLFFSIIIIIALALGTNGPFSGVAFKICRMLIPPYKMIRQTSKIFCLMPSFLAVAGAIAITNITSLKTIKSKTALCLTCILIIIECNISITPLISHLDKKQAAYAAILTDAKTSNNKKPLALVLPLWPGDSHWSSIYQFDASLYNLRLMNGYRPAVPSSYFENIFKKYESINQGIISDVQLNSLLARGCEYILIHENAFPEKVSPFPISLTIERLTNNPRLEMLKQDEHVRSFLILADKKIKRNNFNKNNIISPARLWYKTLHSDGTLKISTRAPVGNTKKLRWDILLNGQGTLSYTSLINSNIVATNNIINNETSSWYSIDIETTNTFFTPTLLLNRIDGDINLDVTVLNAGKKLQLANGESITLPAKKLFHGGYSKNDNPSVILIKEKAPASSIIYGNLIPLPIGEYTLTINIDNNTSYSKTIGSIAIVKHRKIIAKKEIISDNESSITFVQNNNLPVRIEFNYNASENLKINSFTLKRTK